MNSFRGALKGVGSGFSIFFVTVQANRLISKITGGVFRTPTDIEDSALCHDS